MVSEPLFSIYFVGESEADELLEEPHEVITKEERSKHAQSNAEGRMSTRFIRWNYSRRETVKQVDQ